MHVSIAIAETACWPDDHSTSLPWSSGGGDGERETLKGRSIENVHSLPAGNEDTTWKECSAFGGQKQLCCSFCPYTTSASTHMKRHFLRTHASDKPFMCLLCSAAFATAWDHEVHMRSHTGERPFKCNLCPFASSRKFVLMRHVREHTGVKRFACSECAFVCSRSDNLKAHMACHRRDRPYKCSVCNYSTAAKRNLASHRKRHAH